MTATSPRDSSFLRERWTHDAGCFRRGNSTEGQLNQMVKTVAAAFYTEDLSWGRLIEAYDDLHAQCDHWNINLDRDWSFYFPNHSSRKALVAAQQASRIR